MSKYSAAELDAGDLDRRITIEQRSLSRDSATGAQAFTTWTTFATVWASVRESATAAAADSNPAVAAFARPSKVRIRWLSGVDRTMRINLGGGRLLRIIGIAEHRNTVIEFACAEWTHE